MKATFITAVTVELGDIDPTDLCEDLEVTIAQAVDRGCAWSDEVIGVEVLDVTDPDELERNIETEVLGGVL